MKEQHKNYLNDIGIVTEALLNRIKNIFETYELMIDDFSEDDFDIFVSEYITNDGKREYENLWLLSTKYILEAKNFIKEDDFDIVLMDKKNYVQIKKQDYDLVSAGDNSRMNLLFTLNNRIRGDIKASKENCNYLKDVFKKYFRDI